jgi:hypothetical protein
MAAISYITKNGMVIMIKKKLLISLFFICVSHIHAKNMTDPEACKARPESMPLYTHAAIGFTANILEKPLGHPLGFMTNRLMQDKPVFKEGLTDGQNIRRLYRGLPLSLGTSAPTTALEFSVNAFMKKNLAKDRPLTKTEQLCAGATAGIASAFIDTPVDCMIIAQQNTDQSLTKTIKSISTEKTPNAIKPFHMMNTLYRGIFPTILRNGLATGGNLGFMPLCYEACSKHIPDSTACTTASAIGTGILTATATHPFTFIKTKLQGDLERKKYKNSFDVIQKEYSKKGPKAFFKGYWPRTARYCLGAALYKKTYDACDSILNEKHPSQSNQKPGFLKATIAQCDNWLQKASTKYQDFKNMIAQKLSNQKNYTPQETRAHKLYFPQK